MTLTSVKGLCLEKEAGEEMTYWKNDVKMSVMGHACNLSTHMAEKREY